MKQIEGIDLMRSCYYRCIFLNYLIHEKQKLLMMRIKRNEIYNNIRELKSEIDALNDELIRVEELYNYYKEKYEDKLF